MPAKTLLRAVLVWVAILLVAIMNGALRDTVLVHLLDRSAARALSGVILCLCIVAAATLATPWLGPPAPRSRWLIGVVWLVLTVFFETTVAYVQHGSWQQVVERLYAAGRQSVAAGVAYSVHRALARVPDPELVPPPAALSRGSRPFFPSATPGL